MHPITGVSHLLGEAILAEVRPNDRVLDMGTGCGVNAILAASRGADVLAVDINPYAIDAARQNAERNAVADRVEIRHSDVFEAVDGRFDLVIFDPPFRWFAPRDPLEAASTDENYRALTAFFRQAREHLTERGRLLVFFGTLGRPGLPGEAGGRQRFRPRGRGAPRPGQGRLAGRLLHLSPILGGMTPSAGKGARHPVDG